VNARFAFDLEQAGRTLVAGADEAGRGCLAGPLVAAAVVFAYDDFSDADFNALDAVNDSKKIKRERRDAVCSAIVARARQVVVVSLSPGTIDRRGLHVCNLAALRTALEALSPPPAKAFVDGFTLAACAVPHEALLGGDGRSAAVAAASIIAKVTRDRLMHCMHEQYPLWAFDEHVGYATPTHHRLIVEHGVCALHRMSFQSVAYQQLGLGVAPSLEAGASRAVVNR
jgi:ribonuclease HII